MFWVSSGHTVGMLKPCIQGQLYIKWQKILCSSKESCVLGQFWAHGLGCWNVAFKASYLSNGWKSCFLNNHEFWGSSGRTAGDAEILHSKPGVYQMDENRVFVERIMRSGTALGIRLGMLKSHIQGQLCIKLMKIVFSQRESGLLGQFWAYGWGCWNLAF